MSEEQLDKSYIDPNKDSWVRALKFLEAEGYQEGFCAETVAGMVQRFMLSERASDAKRIAELEKALEQIIDEIPEPDSVNECLTCTDNREIAIEALAKGETNE